MSRPRRCFCAIVLSSLCVSACSTPRVSERPIAPPSAPLVTRAAPPAASPPRLVVSIVIDQLPSWALQRYLDALPERGVLRRGVAAGAFFANSRYSSATTLTAPGHATIFTGTTPARHGVLANDVWNREVEKVVPVVDDRKHRVFGHDGAFASPTVLRAETVADALERATAGHGRTVSLSLKDRSAILSGGKKPDLALWFDWGKPGFTTSEYYSNEPPRWLGEWGDRHPPSTRLEAWWPRDPAALERLLGPDDGAGEGDWLLLGRTFPHDARRAKEPYSVFRATPGSSAYLLDLARECLGRFELGQDDTPDLLMLSISGTDYVGHVFGPESWEYVDNLQRVDEMLGAFVAEVEARVPTVRVLITSDHGVAVLPERTRALGRSAERVNAGSLRELVNRALRARGISSGEDVVEAFVPPFVHLTPKAGSEPGRAAVVRALIEALEKAPGIARAFDVRGVTTSPEGADAVRQRVGASLPNDTPGDVYVVLRESSVVDAGMPVGAGTNHGSPWDYDAFVPVIFFGPGVGARTEQEPVAQSRVAATLARLLGIAPPNEADPTPLPGAPAIAARSE